MPYAVENAIFQWEEGERRLRDAPDLERADLERALAAVDPELRRRLGSTFSLQELASLYDSDVDWALAIAYGEGAGSDSAWVVSAAFYRYARQAADFAGGRPHDRFERI